MEGQSQRRRREERRGQNDGGHEPGSPLEAGKDKKRRSPGASKGTSPADTGILARILGVPESGGGEGENVCLPHQYSPGNHTALAEV